MIEFNFKVGDEITCDNWGVIFETITAIGKFYFLSIDKKGDEDYWIIKTRRWFKRKKNIPEFDWKAEGFWASHNDHIGEYRFVKSNKLIWFGINEDMQVALILTKAAILKYYKLCPPPPWAHLIEEVK